MNELRAWDAINFVSPCSALTTSKISLDALREVKAEMEAAFPDDVATDWIFLPSSWQAFRRAIPPEIGAAIITPGMLYGITLRVETTPLAAIERYYELKEHGRRPQLILITNAEDHMTVAEAEITGQLFAGRATARQTFGDDYLSEMTNARGELEKKAKEMGTPHALRSPSMLAELIRQVRPASLRGRIILQAAAAELLREHSGGGT